MLDKRKVVESWILENYGDEFEYDEDEIIEKFVTSSEIPAEVLAEQRREAEFEEYVEQSVGQLYNKITGKESNFETWVLEYKNGKSDITIGAYKRLFGYIKKFSGVKDFSELSDSIKAKNVIKGLIKVSGGSANYGTDRNYRRFIELFDLYKDYCLEHDYRYPIKYNPKKRLRDAIKLNQDELQEVWCQEDILKYLNVANSERLSYVKVPYYYMCFYGCLDPGESVRIRITDIDFETGYVFIREGAKECRMSTYVYLDKIVLKKIEEYINNGRGEPLPEYEDFLFIQKEGKSKGKPFTRDTVSYWARETSKKCGFENKYNKINHKVIFRITGATIRYQEGCSIEDLKEHLRHQLVTTTERKYNRFRKLLNRRGERGGLIKFDQLPYRNINQNNHVNYLEFNDKNPCSQTKNPQSQTKDKIKSPDSRI